MMHRGGIGGVWWDHGIRMAGISSSSLLMVTYSSGLYPTSQQYRCQEIVVEPEADYPELGD